MSSIDVGGHGQVEPVVERLGDEGRPVTVRPTTTRPAAHGRSCFVGISASTGARGLSMHVIEIPPGGASEPHVHRGYETAVYLLEGRVATRYGANLEHEVVNEAGDFLYIPPDLPHQSVNVSATEPARAVIARNDAAERERVEPYMLPDAR